MALNTSFFYFIILWKGHADVMVDGPLGRGSLVAGGWWLVAGSAYGAGSRIGIGEPRPPTSSGVGQPTIGRPL